MTVRCVGDRGPKLGLRTGAAEAACCTARRSLGASRLDSAHRVFAGLLALGAYWVLRIYVEVVMRAVLPPDMAGLVPYMSVRQFCLTDRAAGTAAQPRALLALRHARLLRTAVGGGGGGGGGGESGGMAAAGGGGERKTGGGDGEGVEAGWSRLQWIVASRDGPDPRPEAFLTALNRPTFARPAPLRQKQATPGRVVSSGSSPTGPGNTALDSLARCTLGDSAASAYMAVTAPVVSEAAGTMRFVIGRSALEAPCCTARRFLGASGLDSAHTVYGGPAAGGEKEEGGLLVPCVRWVGGRRRAATSLVLVGVAGTPPLVLRGRVLMVAYLVEAADGAAGSAASCGSSGCSPGRLPIWGGRLLPRCSSAASAAGSSSAAIAGSVPLGVEAERAFRVFNMGSHASCLGHIAHLPPTTDVGAGGTGHSSSVYGGPGHLRGTRAALTVLDRVFSPEAPLELRLWPTGEGADGVGALLSGGFHPYAGAPLTPLQPLRVNLTAASLRSRLEPDGGLSWSVTSIHQPGVHPAFTPSITLSNTKACPQPSRHGGHKPRFLTLPGASAAASGAAAALAGEASVATGGSNGDGRGLAGEPSAAPSATGSSVTVDADGVKQAAAAAAAGRGLLLPHTQVVNITFAPTEAEPYEGELPFTVLWTAR
ncbi:hypothetical protein TSOC_010638 [Tetrabaena socialis]|uniref:Uncharacterized protein n=1 Tax=Tetrabaena socialis TaxID=47790 RepID=A0A2J7ZSR9_9CHLO|nr:hypothetical protein TSOC_010638 [Tetrabaena socialis]|eukprot:PNH03315.1 hypothetical protein TSOC_010638 [Tetrabaena socialis]